MPSLPNLVAVIVLLKHCIAVPSESLCDADDGETCDGVSGQTLVQKANIREKVLTTLNEHSAAKIVKIMSEQNREDVPTPVSNPETVQACTDFYNNFLKSHADLTLISDMWMDLCGNPDMRQRWHEAKDGCIYLPTDSHMASIRDCVEHPNPWHYIYFIEDLFFKRDGTQGCPSVAGAGASTAEGGDTFTACSTAEGFVGSEGECVSAKSAGIYSASNLRVYKLDGLMGLDNVWTNMIKENCSDHIAESLAQNTYTDDESVAQGRSATVPVKFIVCDDGTGRVSATDEQLRLQLAALNRGFTGSDVCTTQNSRGGLETGSNFTAYATQQADMGLRFTHHSTQRVVHAGCVKECNDHVRQLMTDLTFVETGIFKVLICETRLLGRASFPCGNPSTRINLVNHKSLPLGSLSNYNEGHTLTHEMGHYIGLYHTFQSGCSGGDDVSDTNPESSSHSGCPASQQGLRSSCGTPDPVHNFMDYSYDRCLCSFTAGQKARMWSRIKSCMPDIWAMSSVGTTTQPPQPTTQPPLPTTQPPQPTTQPPQPTTQPPQPTTQPPQPTTLPPQPTTQPPQPTTQPPQPVVVNMSEAHRVHFTK